jgi:hypothetical protein
VSELRVVEIDGDPRAHLVDLGQFFDGTGKALCGRKPFPERWGISYDPDGRKSACVACLNVRRTR